jgi:hypothetical protein
VNRLRHSDAGYLRSMQLSSTQLFIFVEGKQLDSYCYAGICESTPQLNVPYEICTAQQLPVATGGKKALVGFFSFLRQRKALVSSLGNQSTACIFFLDKDLDDIQRRQKRSPHFVYTEHYDIQNYIFTHGDLLTGAASAASVNPAILRSQLSDAHRWCLQVAEQWREWIAFCFRVLEDRINCEANYRVASQVQQRLCGALDAQKYTALTHDVANRHGIPVEVFARKLTTSHNKVDRYFAKGEHHRIFKGKWFAAILADDIDRIMAGKPFDRNGLEGRLPSAIATTLDFTEPWTDHFRNPIRNAVDRL